MEKLMLALCSIMESLTYMIVALLTVFAAEFMQREVSWQMAVAFCVVFALLMAYVLYLNKTQGYGRIDDDGDEEEEEDGDDSWENMA